MNQLGVKGQCGANPMSQYFDDVAPFHDFLLGLKDGDTSHVIVAGIVVRPPWRSSRACRRAAPTSWHSNTRARTRARTVQRSPIPRHGSRRSSTCSGRSTSSTICQQDLSGTLDQIGQLVVSSIGNLCLTTSVADMDPATEGVQFDCKVEDVVGSVGDRDPSL